MCIAHVGDSQAVFSLEEVAMKLKAAMLVILLFPLLHLQLPLESRQNVP